MVKKDRSSSVIITLLSTLLIILLLQPVFIGAAKFTKNSRKNCSDSLSSIGECNEEEEMLMDSEVSRRFLAEVNGISYKAIRKGDAPTCGSGEHTPYDGKCSTPIAANKRHDRGCSPVYHCRSGSQ
ncbi:hypothetical protein MKW98_028274 [Papaver atlanticum]|uniref:Uncharacterized protein n=1 Tax=Papaver atlanticum TaxID=357466 RepID=A0AAD4XLW0_9MAGN|nr:hypothetical protein MKW98_028274 [Papaver atlanticum]